ncbi:hypothetical protein N9R43_00010 [bacterium]|nr:hypothetical protein [bacterium]
MNWLQIDRQILGLMRLTSDKNKLYEDIKQIFKWNDSQVEAAVGPLIKRWDWHGMHTEVPVKKKRVTKTTKKAPAKKARATTTKKKS